MTCCKSGCSVHVVCWHQPPERQRKLLCRYGHGGGGVPWLYAPFKEQDEWDNPPIVRYLNVISDQDIDSIKRLSRPKVIAVIIVAVFGSLCLTSAQAELLSWSDLGLRTGSIVQLAFSISKLERAMVMDPSSGNKFSTESRVSKRYENHILFLSMIIIFCS